MKDLTDQSLGEAVEILDRNKINIQILSDFADKEYCAEALDTIISFAKLYLSVEGLPEKMIPEAVPQFTERVLGFNDAIDACCLAISKFYMKKSEKLTEENISEIISKVLFNESLNEDKPVRNLEIYGLAKAIFEAMKGKENE